MGRRWREQLWGDDEPIRLQLVDLPDKRWTADARSIGESQLGQPVRRFG